MCFKCKNKRSEFNQKIYDDNHKKIDYAAFLAAGGVDDESTKQEQQEEVVDVREMDDDHGPPTLYQRYLKKHVVFLKKKLTLTTVQPVIDKVKEKCIMGRLHPQLLFYCSDAEPAGSKP